MSKEDPVNTTRNDPAEWKRTRTRLFALPLKLGVGFCAASVAACAVLSAWQFLWLAGCVFAGFGIGFALTSKRGE